MKKIKKLKLSKEVITSLNSEEQNAIVGGGGPTDVACYTDNDCRTGITCDTCPTPSVTMYSCTKSWSGCTGIVMCTSNECPIFTG